METQPSSPERIKNATELVIPAFLAWIMAITGFLFPILLFLIPLDKWSKFSGMFGACLAVMIVFWIIFLVDIIRSNIRDKSFWILSMIVMPTVAQIFYVSRKKHLLINGNNLTIK